MRKNRKKKAAALMAVSMLLLGVPAGTILAEEQGAAKVHAEDTDSPEEVFTEDADSPEEGGGEGSVSDNDIPEPECTCREKCTAEQTDLSCEVCKTDYSACAYVNPSVRITINVPAGWHNDTTKVYISVEDVAQSGNFAVQSLQAKVTQNGNWMDITEERCVEINEDCTVYALLTDEKGRTYEKSRHIKCFDYTPPIINAAVSDGLLSVRAQDTGSGVKVVYVNGHEFKDLVNGTVNIRLQQFDSGYQYFTISAMDNVGNMSDVYQTKNPYYSDPEVEDKDKKEAVEQLPVSAQPTAPVKAAAQVTEHTKTDSEGNTTLETSPAEQKKAAMREADASETETEKEQTDTKTGKGKEFYTIETESGKVFYLVIDRDGGEEMVYFLTEISENDLLNVTSDRKETLPQNSAVAESALPQTEDALPVTDADAGGEESRTEEPEGETEEMPEPAEDTEENPAAVYIILGVAAIAVIGIAYYFKVLRKKDEDFLDEEDEEEDEEAYDDEEEELAEVDNNPEKDFFADREDEEV